ncbi:ParB/RepB/Spo0J family partition protein [Streptomyces sp. NPDC058084]|uniref:ParB/RepB/Spo0J family partition protein n=1 Tax=Streptomyces sp. NPDC058084 TaxID=3346333 RepID=UPI0036E69463
MPNNLQLGASRDAAEQQRLFSKGTAEVPVADLLPSPENGRKRLRAVENLAESFDGDGVVQALTVVPAAAYIKHYPRHREHVEKSGKPFVVIHGHRRLAAAQMKGLEKVPVFIRKTVAENGSLRLSAIKENEQRLGLDPIEEGAEYKAALEELQISQRELVRKLGNVSQTVVSHKIKLLKLIEPLQHAVIDQWCKQNNLELEFGGERFLTIQDGATVLAGLREDLQQQYVDGALSFEDAKSIVKSKVPLEEQRMPEPAAPVEQAPAPAPQNQPTPQSEGDAGSQQLQKTQPPPAAPAGGQDGPVPNQRSTGDDAPQTVETEKPAPTKEPEINPNVADNADSPRDNDAETGPAPGSAVSTLTERGVIAVTNVKDIYTVLKERLSPAEFTELQDLFLSD